MTLRHLMKTRLLLVALALGAAASLDAQAPARLRFAVTFPASRSAGPIDGRLLVMLSADSASQPRDQFGWGLGTSAAFAIDVEGWKPGEVRYVEATAFGFPVRQLAQLPRGQYRVQALINRYETFTRGDGRTVKLPPDKGEGQKWNAKPGNLYSRADWATVDPSRPDVIRLSLDEEIPPVPAFKETAYVKHVRIRSERLSKFWGRDMYIAAFVTLPWGFNDHPGARYPLVINHGHFATAPDNWRETPPDQNLKADYSARFSLAGYNRIQQEESFKLFTEWTGPGFPRVLLVQIQHATPFYDDSYAVNSANNGPYGDAIQYELIPEIEKRFRGLGAGWARFVFGGSTGGWESMAVQMFYPREYNGAWVACPDPIDFRHYTVVDIYTDTNAYYMPSRFKRTLRPGHRNYLGHVDASLQEMNLYELAVGTKGRSGDQWDVWESVYSPVGDDGYPRRIWDKETGTIDPVTAQYWKEHYDLSWILKRDWTKLQPDLKGKIRLYVGDMDNYYLNNAVYEVEKFLKSAQPPADAVVDYGDRDEHCWNGDHTRGNAYSRLRYVQMATPWFVERMLTTAPAGADLRSWRY
ncbi:MAG: hypothetical protein H7066_15835 [Cytophagaceae bacterium]|nr:hypothetical protein [Gemmatimonadaceae bacterium]